MLTYFYVFLEVGRIKLVIEIYYEYDKLLQISNNIFIMKY